MDLNQACLVVDGWPLPAQPWQPDFTQSLYAETYHALLKSAGMYPSDWSNGLSAAQFVGGTMLLSWDLTPDDSDGTAYLSGLGTVKASLRFAKPLPATTMLLAFTQYDNLVVVDAYRTMTFDYNAWCSGGPYERALGGQGIGWCLHPGRTLAPSPPVPGCLPDQHGSQWHCWGTLGRCLPGGLSARWILWFLPHRTVGIYLPTVARNGLQGRALQYKNATGPVLEGLQTLCFLLPGHAEPRCALGGRHRRIQGIRLPLQWGRDQTPPGIGHTHIRPHIYGDSDHGFSVNRLSTPGGYSDSTWTLLVFIAMDTPPSSCSPPSSASGSSRPCARGVTPCQRLAKALATLLLLTPVLLLAVMDSQSQAWKHAVPLTVWNITDAGGPI